MVLTEEASGKCLMHSWYKLPLQPEHYTNLYSEDLRKFERSPSSPHSHPVPHSSLLLPDPSLPFSSSDWQRSHGGSKFSAARLQATETEALPSPL